MILIIDNYDSFTYNLLQYLGEVSANRIPIEVFRNDAISIDKVSDLSPSHIVISPGPCSPNEAGISLELIRQLAPAFPILGVCLGHQCLGQAFGAVVCRSKLPTHGKVSEVEHSGGTLFSGCPSPFMATRYHSLTVQRETLPDALEITAWTEDGEIMGLAHREHPHVQGLQFHPESIMTKVGKQLLANFLSMRGPGPNCGY